MSISYEQALEFFHGLPKRDRNQGLMPMKKLMEFLGNPQKQLSCIHIGGTNGKGTTAHCCAEIFRCAGYRVGLFTSPYVHDFRERFLLNGVKIEKEELAGIAQQVKCAVEKLEEEQIKISEFEAVTAAAFLYYAGRCDLLCLEVGLGGRIDATNVIEHPVVSVITSISLDHTALLGDTVEAIAAEKAGIIKPGCPCVCYPNMNPDALAVCMERCVQTGSRLYQATSGNIEILEQGAWGSRFSYGGREYEIPLAGEHQIWNAVNAVQTVLTAGERGFPVSPRDIQNGLKAVSLPARFQLVSQSPAVYVDGAHNPEGMEGVAATMSKLPYSPKIAVIGMMADKDCEHALRFVCQAADEVMCVPVSYPRTMDSKTLAQMAGVWNRNSHSYSHWKEALQEAKQHAGKNGTIVICGSFYLAGEVLNTIEQASC